MERLILSLSERHKAFSWNHPKQIKGPGRCHLGLIPKQRVHPINGESLFTCFFELKILLALSSLYWKLKGEKKKKEKYRSEFTVQLDNHIYNQAGSPGFHFNRRREK